MEFSYLLFFFAVCMEWNFSLIWIFFLNILKNMYLSELCEWKKELNLAWKLSQTLFFF